jgi:chromosome segregation ATPase
MSGEREDVEDESHIHIHIPGFDRIFDVLRAIQEDLVELRTEVQQLMTDQESVDADVQQLEAQIAALGTATAAIQTEIQNLQAANPALDLSGLNQAVTDLTTATGNVASLATPPSPPPAP